MHMQTEKLTFFYDKKNLGKKALNCVNVSIKKGSWTALIGPTGSGKSTFAQHLNGLLKPCSGKVYLKGEDIHSKKFSSLDIKRRVGMVFQYPEHQIFEATVYEEVAYGPKNLNLADEAIESAVKEAFNKVGLDYEAFKDRNPLELSGGEKRKVAIAGVLAMNPEVLVLDEPTAGLDPIGRRQILKEIDCLRKGSATIVWVTHNLGEVLDYADSVVVFNEGKVIMQGSPVEVFSDIRTLKQINLGVPQLFELEQCLRDRGLVFDRRFITLEDAATAISQLLRGEGLG